MTLSNVALEEPKLRAMFSGVADAYGTHRPALCEAIVRTSGPILELGMGDSSTPALHDLAEATGRTVCSYDHDAAWVERYAKLRSQHHRIEHVSSWDECPIESTRWAVAFVDHAPGSRRITDIARLVTQADVVVVHDTDDATYGYDRVFGSFAHRLDHRELTPWTTILSNCVDVEQWPLMGTKLRSTRSRHLRTSVVVPCAAKHVARLPELFAALRAQTRAPDEVIVAISGCSLAAVPPCEGTVIHSAEPMSAGANRNRATTTASGDVVIYQDADDLPHRQRIEVIAGLFESYAIDHLMHYFYYMEDEPSSFSIEDAARRSMYRTSLMAANVMYRRGLVEYVTNGNVAITRSVAASVPWPEYRGIGEDQDFNRAVYAHTKRTAVTPLPLITYRHNYSTFR